MPCIADLEGFGVDMRWRAILTPVIGSVKQYVPYVSYMRLCVLYETVVNISCNGSEEARRRCVGTIDVPRTAVWTPTTGGDASSRTTRIRTIMRDDASERMA
ncbi:MAG TPA: hypothetical protein VFD70_01060 [Anaerolineae bacterium]|nr:hypothetical protein [Anaerolineae bacterium]